MSKLKVNNDDNSKITIRRIHISFEVNVIAAKSVVVNSSFVIIEEDDGWIEFGNFYETMISLIVNNDIRFLFIWNFIFKKHGFSAIVGCMYEKYLPLIKLLWIQRSAQDFFRRKETGSEAKSE